MAASAQLSFTRPQRLTPFAFPLMVERLRERVTTEQLNQRVLRLLAEMEAAQQHTSPGPVATAGVPPRRRRSARVLRPSP
jgi:ATP-dependent Lhr-like helicase